MASVFIFVLSWFMEHVCLIDLLEKAARDGEIDTRFLLAMSAYKTLPIISSIHGDLVSLEINILRQSLYSFTVCKNELLSIP